MAKLVAKNAAYLLTVQLCNYLLPFVVVPFLSRALGLEGYGKFALFVGIGSFLLVLIRFGFEFSATREISLHCDDRNQVGKIVAAVLLIKLGLFSIAALLYMSGLFWLADEKYLTLGVGGLLLLAGQTLLPLWYFQGMQRMQFVTIYTLASKVMYVALILLVVRAPEDFGLAVFLYGLAFFLAGLVSLAQVVLEVPLSWNKATLKQSFFDALPFFKSRFLVTAYTTAIVPILGVLGGPAQVAIYSVSEKLYMAAQSAFYPLANALYPYVAKHRDVKLFNRYLILAVAVGGLGLLMAFGLSPWLINWLFGPAFAEAAGLFQWHLVALALVIPSVMLGYPLLAAMGYSKEANGSVTWGATVFFVLMGLMYLFNLSESRYFIWAVIAAEATVLSLRVSFAVTKVYRRKNI